MHLINFLLCERAFLVGYLKLESHLNPKGFALLKNLQWFIMFCSIINYYSSYFITSPYHTLHNCNKIFFADLKLGYTISGCINALVYISRFVFSMITCNSQ